MSASAPAADQDVAARAVDPRAPRRLRHEPRHRTLTVKRVDKIAARMMRVTLAGDLEGFTSLGFDDHVKLFFPEEPSSRGGAANMIARDFTPRRYDAVANELEIDFAIHAAGPATRWAAQASAGQTLAIGGPRGSFIIPTAYDWHLLIADETGLPAIGRRLAELPIGTRVVVLAEVDSPSDQLILETAANATIIWAHRNDIATEVLSKTLATLKLPAGDYYAWVACESLTAKMLRRQLIADHGANPKWMRAAGYWRRGAVAVHETHED